MFFLVLIFSLLADVRPDSRSTSFYFTAEPENDWVKAGGSISLSCDVSSDVDTVYEWRLHTDFYDTESLLLPETSSVLEYGPWSLDMSGLYVSCTADVLGTKVNSRYALIRVTTMEAELTELPVDTTAAAGQDWVRLACGAPAGEPAPYITWQKDSVDYDEANSFVDPLGGLNIINVEASDAGSYTCTANSFEDHAPIVSPPAILTIEGAVSTVDLPTSMDVSFAAARYKITAHQGDPVRVLCGYLGTPTPVFNLGNGTTGDSYASGAKYTVGQHGTWMDIASVEEIGAVECEGSNAGGVQTLNIVMNLVKRVEVYGGKDVDIIERESTVLVCHVSGTVGTYQYSWYKNGVLIEGEIKALLEFVSTPREESGMYQCFVTSSTGKEHTTFALNVQGITTVPVKVTVAGRDPYGLIGAEHAISCVGQGNPVPSVAWYKKEGNSETAISLSNVLFKETFTEMLAVLRFDVITAEDDGSVYMCKASNQDINGPETYDASMEYVLAVVEPIAPIASLPARSMGVKGKPFSLICTAIGSPAPSFSWLKDGVLVAGATSDTLTINKLSSSDEGEYTCTAESQISSSSATSTVIPTSALSGGQVFLVLIIVAVLLLFIAVGALIVIRRNELERRAAEITARDELYSEKEKRDELPVAAYPYIKETPLPNGLEGQDNMGFDVEGGDLVLANGGADLEGVRGETPLRSVLATRSSSGSGIGSRPITPA